MSMNTGKVSPEDCPEPMMHNTGTCPFCTFNSTPARPRVQLEAEEVSVDLLTRAAALVAELAEILAPYMAEEVSVDVPADTETQA